MAERRMFAKTIVTSDAFLDMPCSARCLYFTLGMFADDDGFVNNPRSVMRQCGASDDDMKVLLAKRFVIVFDSGVIVIKHWRVHNYIQKDRYTPTKYSELKAQLSLDENNAYTFATAVVETIEKEALSPTRQKRLDALKNSSLPYSFLYKMRNAFIGETCPICGCKMGVPIPTDDGSLVFSTHMPTIQHNIPISKGGTHEIDNISVICSSCNHRIKDAPTDSLNNDLVKKKWAEICASEGNVSGMDTQVSIGKVSIDKNSKYIPAPITDAVSQIEEWFTAFWAEYPKKKDKQNAYKAFKRVCKSEETFTAIMDGLKKQMPEWKEPRFIPYPSSWLNGMRWEDEEDPKQPQKKGGWDFNDL